MSAPLGGSCTIPQEGPTVDPVIGSSITSNNIIGISSHSLLDISTAQVPVAATSSPTYGQAAQVALNGATAYVLDAAARSLQVVDLDPLSTGPTVSVPPGSDQLVTKDNLVFVNSDSSAQAVIVNTNGQVTPVTKYIPSPSPREQSSFSGTDHPPSLRPPPGAAASTGSQPGTLPIAVRGRHPPPGAGPFPSGGPQQQAPPPAPVSPSAPGAPNVTTVAFQNGAIVVNWAPPASTGSSPVTKYNVTVTSQPARPMSTRPRSTPPRRASVSGGLKGDTTFCAVVQAFNAAGGGPLSLNNGAANTCARTSNDTPGPVGGVTAAGG